MVPSSQTPMEIPAEMFIVFPMEDFFGKPLCPSSTSLALLNLFIFCLLCFSVAFRYRHHSFSSFYTPSSNASTPRHAWEALIFIALEVYLLSVATMRLVSAYNAGLDLGVNFSNIVTLVMPLYVGFVEWAEERQFGVYMAEYRERKAAMDAPVDVKRKDGEGGEDASITSPQQQEQQQEQPAATSSLMAILKKPLSWRANTLPEPTPVNVHIRFHSRATLKALLPCTFLLGVQPEACQLLPSQFLDTTASFVPMIMMLGIIYVVRTLFVLRDSEKFAREELK